MTVGVTPGGSGGGAGGAELIWEWNGTDLTQFGAVVNHRRSGGNVVGTMTPAVIPDPLYSGRNVLRMSGTLEGGFCLPIAGLTLPEQFRIEMEIEPGTAVANVYVGALCFVESGGLVQGISVAPRMNATSNLFTGAVLDDIGGAGSNIIADSSATFVAQTPNRRTRLSSRIARPRGTTPTEFVTLSYWDSGLHLRAFAAGSRPVTAASLTTQWDGLSFDQLGPMVLVQAVPTAVSCHVRDIQVWDETL